MAARLGMMTMMMMMIRSRSRFRDDCNWRVFPSALTELLFAIPNVPVGGGHNTPLNQFPKRAIIHSGKLQDYGNEITPLPQDEQWRWNHM